MLFHRQPRSKFPSVSEHNRLHTLVLLPPFHLNKFLTRLRITFLEPDMSIFFVDKPHWEILLFQNLLGCMQSYSSPHSVRTSSRIDWKTHFLNMHTEIFYRCKIWQRQKFLLFQSLIGCIHLYSRPHFIWTSSWLDYETIFWTGIMRLL